MIEWGHYPNEDVYVEVQQHWLATKANLDHFYEQGQYIQAINTYMSSQSQAPLLVYGESGCGKSSILSHVASTVSFCVRCVCCSSAVATGYLLHCAVASCSSAVATVYMLNYAVTSC